MKRTGITAGIVLILTIFVQVAYAQPRTLTMVTHWSTGSGPGKMLADYIDEYNASQDDVHIELMSDPAADSLEKILLWAASGTLPDILPVSQVYFREFIEMGIMTALPDQAEEIVNQEFVPAVTELVRFYGRLWGYPSEMMPTALTYDTLQFAAKGIGEFPRTWPELVDAATKLTERSADGAIEVAGFGWDVNYFRENAGILMTLLWNDGADLFNEGYTSVDLTSREVFEAVEFLEDLTVHRGIFTPNVDLAFRSQAIRWSGNAAGRRGVAQLGLHRLEEVRSAQVPYGENGTRIAPYYGWAITVTPGAGDVQAAHEFLIWLTTERLPDGTTRMGNVLADLGSIPTARTDIQHNSIYQEGYMSGFVAAVVANEVRPWPTPVNSLTTLTAVSNAVRNVVLGQKSVAQALADAQLEAEQAMSQRLTLE